VSLFLFHISEYFRLQFGVFIQMFVRFLYARIDFGLRGLLSDFIHSSNNYL